VELYQIFSDMVMWSSGDARARHHPRHRPAIVSDVKIEGRPSGQHSSWRAKALRLRGSTARFVSGAGAGRGGGVALFAGRQPLLGEVRRGAAD
jgi:hypothetical protein